MNNCKEKSDCQTLAYDDQAFLRTDDARPIRILAEYLAPLRAFRRERVHDTVVFFGSARLQEDGPLGRYYEAARELARLITECSSGFVYATPFLCSRRLLIRTTSTEQRARAETAPAVLPRRNLSKRLLTPTRKTSPQ